MPTLHLRLLGGFEADIDGEPVHFPTDKVRALLAFLALEADTAHRREAIAGLLWPDWPEDNARRHVRQALYRLKKALEHGGLETDALLEMTRQTAAFVSATADVDAVLLKKRIAETRTHSHAALTGCPTCLEALTEAAERYRGELLAGFSLPDAPEFDNWLTLTRETLHIAVLDALETLTDALLARGELEQARVHAATQIALDPLREEAHRQLMQALWMAGRRNEALSVYEKLKKTVDQELGISPTAPTVALYEQIRTGPSPTQETPSPSARSGSAAFSSRQDLVSSGPARRLPIQTTPFLGREQEIERILEYMEEPGRRLLTLIGPGGIGKTRLAIESAGALPRTGHPFEDGLVFISLADVEAPELLAAAIADQLDLRTHEMSPVRAQLIDHLRDRQILLLLDDVEHIVEAADFLGELLAGTEGVRILATSREPLNLAAETRIPLTGLSYPEKDPAGLQEHRPASGYSAVELFIRAAGRVQPGFEPTPDEMPAIEEICRLVEGLPLAIEIAATWVRVYDCATIAREIERSLDFLVNPRRDIPARHRSMRAVFEHAWSLLSLEQRKTLARSFVFERGFTLDSYLEVTEGSHLELAALLDKSLIQRLEGERYSFHELLRRFLASHPEVTAALAEVRERHTQFFLEYLEIRIEDLKCGYQVEALAEITSEIANIRTSWEQAVRAGRIERLSAVYEGLFHFYDTRSRFEEGEFVFRNAIEALAGRPDAGPLLAQLQARLAWFRFHLGQAEESLALFDESTAILRAGEISEQLIFNLNYHGAVLRHLAEYAPARELLSEALSRSEAHGDMLGKSIALNILGQIDSLTGDLERARERCREALEIKRDIGDRWGMTFSLTYLGRVSQQLGDFSEAEALFDESLALSREFGDRRGMAFAYRNLGDTAALQADAAGANTHYRHSLVLYQAIGSRKEADQIAKKLAGDVLND